MIYRAMKLLPKHNVHIPVSGVESGQCFDFKG